MIYDYFQVIGTDDSDENYTDLFTIVLRNDDIQEVDSKWDGILERKWIDIEPGVHFDQAYPVAKRLKTPLRHGELSREEDRAIEFWRSKEYLRNEFEYSQH